jgi:outer membrane biosynthesis protein TonB
MFIKNISNEDLILNVHGKSIKLKGKGTTYISDSLVTFNQVKNVFGKYVIQVDKEPELTKEVKPEPTKEPETETDSETKEEPTKEPETETDSETKEEPTKEPETETKEEVKPKKTTTSRKRNTRKK